MTREQVALVRHELHAASEELDTYIEAGSPSDPKTEMLFSALVRLSQALEKLVDVLEGGAA